jgi:signal recognition particle receptor subunit beta
VLFDDRFETSWPAFQHGAHGVVLVLDSSKSDYAKSAERFSTLLSNKPPGLSHCLILLMGNGPSNLKLSKCFEAVNEIIIKYFQKLELGPRLNK